MIMMEILVKALPGVGMTCAFFLFVLSGIQFKIFYHKNYRRSRSLGLFCLFAGVFALEQFIVQSRLFSPSWTHCYVMISSTCYCLSLVFYMKSLNFFVAVPKWIYRVYIGSAILLSIAAFGEIPAHLIFNKYLSFDPSEFVTYGNYFVDSYSTRIGRPIVYLTSILSLSGLVVVIGALALLRNILKTTQDIYLIIGLVFSIFASVKENFFLPFTFTYFVPIIFLANLFEAFRMNSLAYREYMHQLMEPPREMAPESEKYQNSNLTEERIEELSLHLKHVLENQKPYLNPNLHSEDLAKKIGIPAYQLSQVVNIGLNITFFELLAQYRVLEVKKRLKDTEYKDETIIDIAYASGFNSKSAFNTAFKKQTGMTPSEFRKS